MSLRFKEHKDQRNSKDLPPTKLNSLPILLHCSVVVRLHDRIFSLPTSPAETEDLGKCLKITFYKLRLVTTKNSILKCTSFRKPSVRTELINTGTGRIKGQDFHYLSLSAASNHCTFPQIWRGRKVIGDELPKNISRVWF